MATVAAPITDADIFSEVIDESPDMPPEFAKLVLSFHFSEAQNARMLDLADKGNREPRHTRGRGAGGDGELPASWESSVNPEK